MALTMRRRAPAAAPSGTATEHLSSAQFGSRGAGPNPHAQSAAWWGHQSMTSTGRPSLIAAGAAANASLHAKVHDLTH